MKNLKPFDLQAALSGKAVMLRGGEKAYVRWHETELGVDEHDLLSGFDWCGRPLTWAADGSYVLTLEHELDIIGMYPETRVINGFEVPAPETKEPVYDADFYLASPIAGQLYRSDIWGGHRTDKIRLERGLVFLNKEDAVANAKAMLGIDPHEGDES